MEAISTLYYYVAATAALQMKRLRERGGEKGVDDHHRDHRLGRRRAGHRRHRRGRHQGSGPTEHRQHEHAVGPGYATTVGRVAGEGLATRCNGVPGDGHRAAGAAVGDLRRDHLRAVVACAEPRPGCCPTWSGTGPPLPGLRGPRCCRGAAVPHRPRRRRDPRCSDHRHPGRRSGASQGDRHVQRGDPRSRLQGSPRQRRARRSRTCDRGVAAAHRPGRRAGLD